MLVLAYMNVLFLTAMNDYVLVLPEPYIKKEMISWPLAETFSTMEN